MKLVVVKQGFLARLRTVGLALLLGVQIFPLPAQEAGREVELGAEGPRQAHCLR